MNVQIDEQKCYDAVIVGGGLAGLTTAYQLRNKNILVLEKEARFGDSLGRRYCDLPERFSIGFKPRKEATSGADLKALLPKITIMIQAVLAPTPGMVHSRLKFWCSDGVDFTHSRIARLNVITSVFNRLTARAIDCYSRRWKTIVLPTFS